MQGSGPRVRSKLVEKRVVMAGPTSVGPTSVVAAGQEPITFSDTTNWADYVRSNNLDFLDVAVCVCNHGLKRFVVCSEPVDLVPW